MLVEDVWGERKSYKHVWPDRVDQFTIDDPEKWVQSACVMSRLFESCRSNENMLIYFAAMGVDSMSVSKMVKSWAFEEGQRIE
jgi:hypothetical protein